MRDWYCMDDFMVGWMDGGWVKRWGVDDGWIDGEWIHG
jgi:hypothetical protein